MPSRHLLSYPLPYNEFLPNIIESSELEGTHIDHQVQLLLSIKFDSTLRLVLSWCRLTGGLSYNNVILNVCAQEFKTKVTEIELKGTAHLSSRSVLSSTWQSHWLPSASNWEDKLKVTRWPHEWGVLMVCHPDYTTHRAWFQSLTLTLFFQGVHEFCWLVD